MSCLGVLPESSRKKKEGRGACTPSEFACLSSPPINYSHFARLVRASQTWLNVKNNITLTVTQVGEEGSLVMLSYSCCLGMLNKYCYQ